MEKDLFILQIIERVKQEKPEKIVLFGSYAYGNPDKESDIDLFVVKDLKKNELRDFRIQLKLKLWDLIKQWDIPVDIIVDNQERINQRIAEGDMFYKEIFSKGNIIYA
jgi:predicted nucleotidyltransferase